MIYPIIDSMDNMIYVSDDIEYELGSKVYRGEWYLFS